MEGRFPTTHWSIVLAAAGAAEERSGAALAELCEAYWSPLYVFVRRQGAGADEARDLVQGYFAVLLEKGYLGDVHRERGRFRSFLLASLKHYLANERDRERARKRAPAGRLLSLDTDEIEERLGTCASGGPDAEQEYERRWALTLLGRALARLAAEAAAGGDSHFERLRPFLTSGEDHVGYREVASDLGISVGAVKTAVYRLRRHFGELLRAEVAHTVADPLEIDEELRHLLAALAP